MQFILEDNNLKKRIKEIKEYSQKNILDLTKGIPKSYVPVGDGNNHVCRTGNIKIVYSIENQPNVGNCHHVSVSKLNKYLPNYEIVEKIMEYFEMGHLKDKKKRKIWIENNYAVNIVQPIYQENLK